MEFAVDFISENNVNRIALYPEFIYDERRFYAKLYVFIKLLGLIFYTVTLSNCNKSDLYIMIIIMFFSSMNSLRYEYKHYQRYGTVFSSIDEFEIWKKKQLPNSRVVFSAAELTIKTVFFVKTFPPQFEFSNLCDIGESVFKIHIFIIFMIYVLCGIFSMFIFSSFCCIDNLSQQSQSRNSRVEISVPIPILVIDNQNNECCICLDTDTQLWSVLPCGHKFHSSCISSWLRTKQSCPICRYDINLL